MVSIAVSRPKITVKDTSNVTWVATNATSVTVTGAGIVSSAASGSQSVGFLAPGAYTYKITGTNAAGTSQATAILQVSPSKPDVIIQPSVPTAVVGPSSQTITLGSQALFSIASTGTGSAAAVLVGNNANIQNPPPSIAVTPLNSGVHQYTYTVSGYARMRWRITGAEKIEVVGPVGTVDVTDLLFYDVSIPGQYTVIATAAGIPSTSDPVTAVINTASATAQVVVNPRIDFFRGVDPVVPTLSLAPATQTIDFSDMAVLNASVTNAGSSTLSGNSLSVTNPSGTVPVSPGVGGILTYTLSATGGNGTLSWSSAGQTSMQMNGAAVVGTSMSAPPGTYTLQVFGNDGTSSTAGPVTIGSVSVVPVTAEVRVRPKIVSFTALNVPAPSSVFTMSPTSGVNPLPVTLTWAANDASSITVSGPSVTSTVLAGTANPTLGPGPQTFTLTAQPKQSTVAWSILGANTLSLNTPTLGAVDVTGLGGSYSTGVDGTYTIVATGPDGLTNTSSGGVVTIPPVLTLTRSLTVDVTLFVGATAGGSVTGSGVKPYGSTATATATPGVGYYFAGWSGDYLGTLNPASITMNNDKAIMANFGLQTFNITTLANPVGAGTVAGAGTYTFGAPAAFSASPDSTHRFLNWSGLASGTANPTSITVASGGTVTANFAIIQFTLTTSTAGAGGGTVTPGGVFNINSVVPITAIPDAVSRFQGWAGDAAGIADPLSVVMTGNKNIIAVFTPKLPQTITFPNPGTHETGQTVTFAATASSGLPIVYTVISGPATIISATQVLLTGTGSITIQADQAGDNTFLPAPSVRVSFSSLPPPRVTFSENGGDTSLQNSKNKHPNHTASGP